MSQGSSGVARGANMAVGGCIALLVLVGFVAGGIVLLVNFSRSLPPPTQTLTVRVAGDEGTPYEVAYETARGSYADRGKVPADYAVTLTTGSGSEDYVRAAASKLEGADEGPTGDDDLVGVDLQLVSQDGAILDEADMEKNVLNYSLNRVSVEADAEDLANR